MLDRVIGVSQGHYLLVCWKIVDVKTHTGQPCFRYLLRLTVLDKAFVQLICIGETPKLFSRDRPFRHLRFFA